MSNQKLISVKILNQIFSETLLLFTIFIVTTPVWAGLFLDILELEKEIEIINLTKLMPYVVLLGISIALFKRKWWALPCFLPVVYYYTGLGEFGSVMWWAIFVVTAYAFTCMIIKGHVRSLLYLFLIIYSAYFLNPRMALINGVTYAFLRFVYMAFEHNAYVFINLGLKKSLYHLGKTFLYWSPLLCFILPINFITTSINNTVTSEIYRFTVVDSVEFQKDTALVIKTDRFKLRPNVTTVLYLDSGQQIVETSLNSRLIESKLKEALSKGAIDSAHQWMITQFIDTNLMHNAKDHFYSRYVMEKLSGKGSPIVDTYFSKNQIDFGMFDPEDTVSSEAISRILSRRDPLRKKQFEIGLNSIEFESNWLRETNKNNLVISGLVSANNKKSNSYTIQKDHKTNSLLGLWVEKQKLTFEDDSCHTISKPTAIVLKDIALDKEPFVYGNLYENINGAMITTFKSFTNKVIKRIEKEVGDMDLGAIAQNAKDSPDAAFDAGRAQIEDAKNKANEQFKNIEDKMKQGHAKLIGEVNAKNEKCIIKINEHRDKTLEKVTEEYNAIFPEPLLKIDPAKWYQVVKLATNAIKKRVNKQYSKQKKETKADIDNRINNAYAGIKTKVNTQFDKVENKINEVYAQSKLSLANVNTSVNNSFNGLNNSVKEAQKLTGESLTKGVDGIDIEKLNDVNKLVPNMIRNTSNEVLGSLLKANRMLFIGLFFYSFFGSISFLYLILQSFLYIFARVTVSKENKVYVSLNTNNKISAQGTIKKCGDNYIMPKEEEHIYYVSRKYEPSGKPPSFSIPFKTTSILPRLKSKTYFMNKVNMNGNGDGSSVHFRAIGSQEFVEWTLAEGEEVTFDLNDLVAMSDTLKLKSVVSFKITTLILGKIFHKVVEGPGKLILMTEGRPIIPGESSANDSLAQNRIVAFSKGTRFEIDSELNVTDVYMSGFYLKKMPEDLIIIDADAHGKPSLGLIQYVKKLIFPF